jgi:general stress protein 26
LTWDDVVAAARRIGREAFVASVDEHHRPHLALVWVVTAGGSLYFVSDRTAPKARNLATNPEVAVHWPVGGDDGEGDQLFVRGRARFEEDAERRSALWDSALWDDLSRWYPGPQAPELAFVEIVPRSASLTPDWGAGTARRWHAG